MSLMHQVTQIEDLRARASTKTCAHASPCALTAQSPQKVAVTPRPSSASGVSWNPPDGATIFKIRRKPRSNGDDIPAKTRKLAMSGTSSSAPTEHSHVHPDPILHPFGP